MIPIGSMREQVTIKQFTTTTSTATGEQTDTWADLATVWAKVEPLMGRERYLAQAIDATLTYRVAMRYRSGLTPKMRIVWASKTLEIHSVSNEGALDRFSIADCSETS